MPFQIVRNDIIHMNTDAIVNTANPRPEVGSGLDALIHQAAGPELLAARQMIGKIPVGEAAVTPGFQLPARYVIHAVGPVWRGGLLGEERLLRRCFDSALRLALDQGCESVALPLISTGNYRFPKDKALAIALSAIRDFLSEHEMQVTLVVFDRESFRLSEKLSWEVASYIDEHYVQRKTWEEYEAIDRMTRSRRTELAPEDCSEASIADPDDFFTDAAPAPRRASDGFPKAARPAFSIPLPKRPARESGKSAAAAAPSLDQLLKKLDAGFSETLLHLIDRTGKKDSEIYTRANVSRQHFSKIRNNPAYKPTKATALAFAIALELDMAQTRDLIGRAGYALTNSSVFDVIIMYFIERRIYDLYQINLALFEHDQSLLGQ